MALSVKLPSSNSRVEVHATDGYCQCKISTPLSKYHKEILLTISAPSPFIENAALVSPVSATGAAAFSSCSCVSERNWYVLLSLCAFQSQCSLIAPSQFPSGFCRRYDFDSQVLIFLGLVGPMISGGHPQNSLTPAQMQAQQQQALIASDRAKLRSRKPTDKNIPEGVEDCVIGDGVQRYRELKDIERRLDATMMRKRLDIQDAVNRNVKVSRQYLIW